MCRICKFLSVLLLLLVYTFPANAGPDSPIVLNLDRTLYEDSPSPFLDCFPRDWITVPGAVELEIVGIHDIAISYLRKRVRRYAREQIWEHYNTSNISQEQFRREMEEIGSEWNYYGNWWDRSWLHSLLPEKGGAPKNPQKRQVGWEITIPRDMPIIWWIKNKLEKIGDIWLDDERAYINLRDKNFPRLYKHNSPRAELSEPINVVVEGKDYSWYQGLNYHLRFRPAVRIKPGAKLKEIFTEYSLKMVIEIFVEDHTIHFADLIYVFRHNIQNNNEIIHSLAFAILTW